MTNPTAQELVEYLSGTNEADLCAAMQKYGLTQCEARLFLILRNASGQLVQHDTIHARMYWDHPDGGPLDNIKTHVHKLRRKLGADWQIKTVWRTGYVMERAEK